MENYRDVPGYENHYQVSDLGNVRSLKHKHLKNLISIINASGYLQVSLSKTNNIKVYRVHQLVAMAFLNFKPNKHVLVVNHINFDRTDNRLINLEIVTSRKNGNKLHIKSSSKYVGVSFRKDRNKWAAEITLNKKKIKLGHYLNELDAHKAYQCKLLEYESAK